jgi:alpha-ribazole phosphatase
VTSNGEPPKGTATGVRAEGRLWVARHAPAVDPLICYGRTDVAVQIAPNHAAKRLLEEHPGTPPRRVWSSPASRCRLVAEHLAEKLEVPLTIDGALAELDFGAWEGRPWAAIKSEEGAAFEAWMANWQHRAPPRGECPLDIEARVRAWVAALSNDGDAWLIAHSGVVRALRVVLEGSTWLDAMQKPVAHLSWSSFALR